MGQKELVLTRVLDAPRNLVWKAWTDPALMKKWWGPAEYNCPGAKIDLRIGGSYLLGMGGPDGKEHWVTGN
jgi:uncharacterized protein YndB with AHSA1/START domain